MTLDASRLDVPEILEEDSTPLGDLQAGLMNARLLPSQEGLQHALDTLSRLNHRTMTLLERQRALQSLTDEYRHYGDAGPAGGLPANSILTFCFELTIGYKHLLRQILHGRTLSLPHLAWCLYMAQYFLAQAALRYYQSYRQPVGAIWRNSHLLYRIGEQHGCLDEPVATAFEPRPAQTLRGVYQQTLLLALSSPFRLAEGEASRLFGALAPLAGQARLLPCDTREWSGQLIDLESQDPFVTSRQQSATTAAQLRRLDIDALLDALRAPAPLRSDDDSRLLEEARPHWEGIQRRRHARTEEGGTCHLVIGIESIQTYLLAPDALPCEANLVDASDGGARLSCQREFAEQLPVGQLTMIIRDNGAPTLAVVRWRNLHGDRPHFGLRYLHGQLQPLWLRRAPGAQRHPAILQSIPFAEAGWRHGLWLPNGRFLEGGKLWLELIDTDRQMALPLARPDVITPLVSRHPLRLARSCSTDEAQAITACV